MKKYTAQIIPFPYSGDIDAKLAKLGRLFMRSTNHAFERLSSKAFDEVKAILAEKGGSLDEHNAITGNFTFTASPEAIEAVKHIHHVFAVKETPSIAVAQPTAKP